MYTMTRQQHAGSIKVSKNGNTKHPGGCLTRQREDDNTKVIILYSSNQFMNPILFNS